MNKSYQKIIIEYKNKLLTLNHVVGIGYGKKIKKNKKTDENSIIVMVDEKIPKNKLEEEDIIPEKIENFKTDVQEVGKLKLLNKNRNEKFRPAPPGVSIGHYKVTAGTLGAIVKDNKTDEPLILSNNHILANISNGRDKKAKIGDPILQPASYDNGSEEKDIIANLVRFIPLNDSKGIFDPVSNTVDCAVAKPINSDIIEDNILEIGKINGVKNPEIDMKVIKSGRTTGLTEANIRAIDSTVRVNLDSKREAIFTDQIVTSSFSDGGDSGSLVLDKDKNAVGLLFAGSKRATICNKITNVMKELDIDFYENEVKEDKKESKPKVNGRTKDSEVNTIFLLLILLIFNFTVNR